MTTKNKLLSVLSDAEQEALYGLPDFDDAQRLEFLALTETELALASSRPGLHAQVYCLLQIGYFKAKHAFFRFDWSEVEDDCAFVMSRYFHGDKFERKSITKHEHYTQRERVAELFGYQLWAANFLPQLGQQATQTVRRDVTPGFVVAELLVWLNKHKIIRPGYTTLQELISETLSTERRRLAGLLAEVLDDAGKAALAQLLVRDDNFAILCWFGPRFEPRFTNLNDQLKELYCADDLALYENFLIRPVGQADMPVIVDEKPKMDQIVATIGLKEMTQGTLIRKLCTYTATNPTRRAIFEFDKLVRSIYTLRYLRDPQLERNVHRSQNRIESYHQLRSTIAQVGGKKELTGRTDIEIEISNQCARLVANTIIYYNSAILSHLLTKCEASGNTKAVALITQMSPAAWRHILLNGHYTFQSGDKMIDLDTLLAGLDLG